MTAFDMPNLTEVFVPDLSLVESVLRGTLVYFGILVLFRFVLKRQTGGVGLSDIMLVVLVSECVSTAINANAKSVTSGLVSVSTMLFWSFVVDWASSHSKWLRRRITPAPLPLIVNGRVLHENLRKEQVTLEELDEELRLKGVDDRSRVKAARIESSGELSVIEKEKSASNDRAGAGNGQTTAGSAADLNHALAEFLAAAEALQSSIESYESRADDQKQAAKDLRALLTRHGLRRNRWLSRSHGPASRKR
jgi:uncharacterized membrane protein YcaP (DUF421 family)